jgi:DNA-binding CsgD family transcriptional regulator
MKADVISVVEAAYDCEADWEGWYARLREQVAPALDRGFGVVLWTYDPKMNPDDVRLRGAFSTPGLLEARNASISAYPELFHQVLGSAGGLMNVLQVAGVEPQDAPDWAPFASLRRLGVQDVIGLVARDPSGHAIVMSAPSPDLRRPSRGEQLRWSRVAAHIGAGARLRRALHELTEHDLADGAEAILSPTGTVVHAETPAQGKDARESLRRAAKAIDRARSKPTRTDEDEALDIWQGLVAGRWSLVDRFDTDGRRYLVARKNDPDVQDPRALTARERHVLAYAAMGQPLKLIAYSLGLSVSTVSVNRRSAMRKLGLRTHADVVALFSPTSGLSQGG